MSNQTKKSLRHKIFMLTILAGITVALVFGVIEKRESRITSVIVKMSDVQGKSLITKKELLGMLSTHVGYEIKSSKISQLPIEQFEGVIEEDNRINECQIYIDKLNRMVITVHPSQPIVRIESKNGSGFYLDQYGNKINLSKSGTIRVPVATGFIESYSNSFLKRKEESTLYQVYDLAKRLYDDPQFLSPLIEQINVEEDGSIVMVPKVGREKIVFGKYEDVEHKFYNLSEFYRKGLPKAGWNKYEELTLNWKGQVAAKRKDLIN